MAETPDAGPERSRMIRLVTAVSCVALTFTAITFSAELHLKVGLPLFTEQGLAVIFACALAVIFLKLPLTENRRATSPHWHDKLFALLGFSAGIYLAVRFDILTDEFFYRQTEAFVIGIILIPLTIEALRRTAGWSLTSIVLAFFVYAFWGDIILCSYSLLKSR